MAQLVHVFWHLVCAKDMVQRLRVENKLHQCVGKISLHDAKNKYKDKNSLEEL